MEAENSSDLVGLLEWLNDLHRKLRMAPETARYILGTIIISSTKTLWLVLRAEQSGTELIKNNAWPTTKSLQTKLRRQNTQKKTIWKASPWML